MEPVTLRTERLELSLPREDDVDAIFEACQDADTQRYTTVPAPYERRHAEEFVPRVAQQWDEGVHLTWAMRDGDTLAGVVGIYRIDGQGAGELGYWVSPWSRRRGFIVEASRAVLDWGFGGGDAGDAGGLGLQRIEWLAVVGNDASARAARSLAFRFEGVRRLGLAGKDGRVDGWSAALLASDDRTPQPWPVLGD